MKTQIKSILVVILLLVGVAPQKLTAANTASAQTYFRLYGEGTRAMVAMSFDVAEASQLSSVALDLGAGSQIESFQVCPSNSAGEPDLENVIVVTQAIQSEQEGALTISLGQSLSVGSGTWWSVITLEPAFRQDPARSSPELGCVAASGDHVMLCGNGTAAWVVPRFLWKLADVASGCGLAA